MEELFNEVYYRTAHSGGSGGQHVNKVETKVILYFNVKESRVLSEKQKEIIARVLKNRINKHGVLQLSCDSERSQLSNKLKVQQRFSQIIGQALKEKKPRKNTRPPKKLNEERLKKKKLISEKKQQRKFNFRNRG